MQIDINDYRVLCQDSTARHKDSQVFELLETVVLDSFLCYLDESEGLSHNEFNSHARLHTAVTCLFHNPFDGTHHV